MNIHSTPFPPLRRARDLAEAHALLATPGAMPLAGATDVIPKLRHGTLRPALLVDLGALGLQTLKVDGQGTLHLGAGVTAARLCAAGGLLAPWPILATAASWVGSPQIRSRATVGGNLCTASPCADLVLALLCLDARALLSSAAGERVLPLGQFLRGPGQTALGPGELVLELLVPQPLAGSRFAFEKAGNRSALIIAQASMALRVTLDGDRIRDSALAWGSVAPTTVRSPTVEAALFGHRLDAATIAAALAAVDADIHPIDDQRASAAYRRLLCQAFLRRALTAWQATSTPA